MAITGIDAFQLSAAELQARLAGDAAVFPELETARGRRAALRDAPQTQVVLPQTQHLLEYLDQIPITPYTFYRRFVRDGERKSYETPYFEKRAQLAGAALRLFLGQNELKDHVQDYIWSICEESNWVVPAHEDRVIDLFAAETGFELAETLSLLGETLDAEVRHRVRREVEHRIFDPYLRFHNSVGWYKGHNNWNGVCNSSVAATFLLLEPEPARMARALELALRGLEVFLSTAFESDGSSTEGVAYWHYGLINFVAFAELLRARSRGAIDLLESQHIRHIAAYPAKLLLSGSWFASFSDCDETVHFNPGIIARLAERTGERSLLGLLAPPAEIEGDWRLPMMLRNMLWWDGDRPARAALEDAVLPVGGVARLAAGTPADQPFVVAIKAGHNAENHNQNDVGSFLIHAEGENLLTDPGRGLYSRAYFGPQRYENIFANSYGHSVPRIDGQLQQTGREYGGQLIGVETEGAVKRVQVELGGAYGVEGLRSIRRELRVAAAGDQAGRIWLQDDFQFEPTGGAPHEVEEALITWQPVEVDGTSALIRGRQHTLRLTLEAPDGATFELEQLKQHSEANAKPEVLKRLRFTFPVSGSQQARVRMDLQADIDNAAAE